MDNNAQVELASEDGSLVARGYSFFSLRELKLNWPFYLSNFFVLFFSVSAFAFVVNDEDGIKDLKDKVFSAIALLSVLTSIFVGRYQLEKQRQEAIKSQRDFQKKMSTINHKLELVMINVQKTSLGSIKYDNDSPDYYRYVLGFFWGSARQALLAVYRRDYEGAGRILGESQDINRKHRSFIEAQIAFLKQEYKQASRFVETALVDFDFPEARRLYGKILQEQACSPEVDDSRQRDLLIAAVAQFKIVIEAGTAKNDWILLGAAYNDKGRTYLLLNKLLDVRVVNGQQKETKRKYLDEASKAFISASQFYPSLEWAHHNLGATKWYLGEIADNPKNKKALFYEALGHYQEAIRTHEGLLKDSKTLTFDLAISYYNCADAYYELMLLAIDEPKVKEAYVQLGLHYCEMSIREDSGYVLAYLHKAKFLFAIREEIGAKAALTEAEKLVSSDQSKRRESHVSFQTVLFEVYQLQLDILKKQAEKMVGSKSELLIRSEADAVVERARSNLFSTNKVNQIKVRQKGVVSSLADAPVSVAVYSMV